MNRNDIIYLLNALKELQNADIYGDDPREALVRAYMSEVMDTMQARLDASLADTGASPKSERGFVGVMTLLCVGLIVAVVYLALCTQVDTSASRAPVLARPQVIVTAEPVVAEIVPLTAAQAEAYMATYIPEYTALAAPYVVPGLGEVTRGVHAEKHGMDVLAARLLLSQQGTECRDCLDGRTRCKFDADKYSALGVYFKVVVDGIVQEVMEMTALITDHDYAERATRGGICP